MDIQWKQWYKSDVAKSAGVGIALLIAFFVVLWPVGSFHGSARWFGLGLWIMILLLSGLVAMIAVSIAEEQSEQITGQQTELIASDADLKGDAKRFRRKIGECLLDSRISGYISRSLVSTEEIIESLANGDAFEHALNEKSYAELTACRVRALRSDTLNSDVISRGEFNPGSVTALIGILLIVVLAMTDVASARPLALGITLATLSSAGFSGALLARAREGSSYTPVKLSFAGMAMLISIGFIAVPYFILDSNWTPMMLFPLWIALLATSYLLCSEEKIEQCIDLLIVGARTANWFFLEWWSSRLEDEWLDGCVESIIMPQAVLAINIALGEDKDRLLVEQDSEGLRKLQDPSLTVSTGSAQRIASVLSQMDGGSIALSGPRGAGKSTLLRRFTGTARIDITTGRCITVFLPAPAEYVPKDFLSELFQRICEAYLVFTNRPLPEAIHRERVRLRFRGVAARGLGIVRFSLRMSVIIGFVIVALFPLIKAGAHYISGTIPSDSYGWYNHDKNYLYKNFYEVRDRWMIARFAMAAVALCSLPKAVRLWRTYIRPRKEPELPKKAREYLMRLRVDKTVTWGAGLTTPIVRGIGLSLNKGISAAYVPWTLPELVGHMRRFMQDIADEFSESKHAIIVGIDEIDRIGSLEQAERFLGEIKAIFGVERCFFLVAVAEDVGSVFAQRTTAGRSILDNSFEDIVAVEPLNIAETRELLLKRVTGFTPSFVYLVHVLSGGLPRELIRVTRRLVEVNHELILQDPYVRMENLAFALAKEQLIESIRAARNQMSRLRLHPQWTDFFEELRSAGISLQHASPFFIRDSYIIFRKLSEISVPVIFTDQEDGTIASDDQIAARGIVRDFAAFSYFCMTVVDAFDKETFDFQRVQDMTASGAAGSYEELSAARIELSFSSENSRVMTKKFRSSLFSTENGQL